MSFIDLSEAQQSFLASHTTAGKALAQAAKAAPVDPLRKPRLEWHKRLVQLRDTIAASPAALDTSKLDTALDKAERMFQANFDPVPAKKALLTIHAAFEKLSASTKSDTVSATARLKAVQLDLTSLLKLAFPDKKPISDKIKDLLSKARTEIETGDFATANRDMDKAETQISTARIGVDVKAAKDLKPADLKVLMKTKDGQAQLDAIVDNLTDDVPPNVMMSILEARFSLDRRLFQSTHDRENSMLDKSKHGAMLDTDSPKLKKFYKKMMDKQAADEN